MPTHTGWPYRLAVLNDSDQPVTNVVVRSTTGAKIQVYNNDLTQLSECSATGRTSAVAVDVPVHRRSTPDVGADQNPAPAAGGLLSRNPLRLLVGMAAVPTAPAVTTL